MRRDRDVTDRGWCLGRTNKDLAGDSGYALSYPDPAAHHVHVLDTEGAKFTRSKAAPASNEDGQRKAWLQL